MDIELALKIVSEAIEALMIWDIDISAEDAEKFDMAEETLYNFVREHTNDL